MEDMKLGDVNSIQRVYLIDTENIGRVTLSELEQLRDNDIAIIFESDQSFKLSFEDALLIDQQKICSIKTVNGSRNAMDFMIATVLGHLVTESKDRIYIIVSRDKGYDEIVKYWKLQGLYVFRQECVYFDTSEINERAHRIKKLTLKELDHLYGSNVEIKNNEDILRKYIDFRSNEDVHAIAQEIFNSKNIRSSTYIINDMLKYNKQYKLEIIKSHWYEFFHCY